MPGVNMFCSDAPEIVSTSIEEGFVNPVLLKFLSDTHIVTFVKLTIKLVSDSTKDLTLHVALSPCKTFTWNLLNSKFTSATAVILSILIEDKDSLKVYEIVEFKKSIIPSDSKLFGTFIS